MFLCTTMPIPAYDWKSEVVKEKSNGVTRYKVVAAKEPTIVLAERQCCLLYHLGEVSGIPLKISMKSSNIIRSTAYEFLDRGEVPQVVCRWQRYRSRIQSPRSYLDGGLPWSFENWTINNLINNGEVEILRALSWPTGHPTLQYIREYCYSRSFGYGSYLSAKRRIATLIFRAAQSKENESLGAALIRCWRKVRKEAESLGVSELDVPGSDVIRDIALIQIERAMKRVARASAKWKALPAIGWDGPSMSTYVGVIPFFNLSQKVVMHCEALLRNNPRSRTWLRKMTKPGRKPVKIPQAEPDPILNIWLLDISDHFRLFPDLVAKFLDTSYEKDWPALGAP
uniref:Nonstructural protein n=1 Tax=Alxa tick phlebovirus TaxID=2977130 RepID=A0A977R7U0_9VIRU|nr:MAG: nonstructural protein [Alxa tick phlebovirus]